MTTFRQVQFIGYAISTKPACCPAANPADYGNRKYYLGYAQEDQDIDARIALLKEVVEKAAKAFSRNPDVLKILVVPEFFFRGAQGAYAGSEVESRLRNKLESVLAETNADIDIAVWGTALLAEQAVDMREPLIRNALSLGDDYLHVYEACREFRSASGKATPTVRDILFELDVLEDPATRTQEPAQDPLATVLEQLLRGCDRNAPLTVHNKSQIMLDGKRCLTVQKQGKSCVDFVLNYYRDQARTQANQSCYVQTVVKYPPIAQVGSENKQTDQDQYSVFEWRGLKIGIEICLDHVRGRLHNTVNDLDLQIIPSCGAEVTAEYLAARPGGYVFNCDGDYTLPAAQNGQDAHTQLYRVEDGGPGAGRTGRALGKRLEPVKLLPINHDGVERLFPNGAGELHVYAPVDL